MFKCSEFCPFCYANIRGRSAYKGHRGYRAPRKVRLEGVQQMLRRQQKGSTDPASFLLSAVPTEVQLYPSLAEFLFVTRWPDDGSVRETGTVLIFGDGTNLKAMLNDRAQSLVAFLTIDQEAELLSSLDRALDASSTDWRPAKKYAPRK